MAKKPPPPSRGMSAMIKRQKAGRDEPESPQDLVRDEPEPAPSLRDYLRRKGEE